ncbi:hypothetical protein [Planctomyces sp. SH-PL62]|uniref:hypothetical protein n=1 Tax=Planctomyces sp. SH-PL62 TaxID=1636152 RepID=UPI00078DDA05|nr:hypothetical protein [Planctomyces sp. SH-PL62]AMV39398.1 hypothetical protein VT85_18315 [Planctomyces sp. SH-PL62]
MEGRSALRRMIGPTALWLACGLAGGCVEELGPEAIPTTPVSGVVTLGGKPLGRGWVEFQPLDGTLGDPTSARIHQDGSFQMARAPLGLNVVRLVDAPIEIPGAIQLLRNASPIRRTTLSPPGPPIRIDVLEELVRFNANPEASR